MAWRTATGKILLALAGTVGVALVVFVVVPWLQAPPPPASPASPEEIIEEVLASPGDEDGEAADEAPGEAVSVAAPVAEEAMSAAPVPVAESTADGSENQAVVSELRRPLTADEVAGAVLDQPASGMDGGDEAVAEQRIEAAVELFAEAVLEKLDEMVAAASPGASDAVVTASAPSVDEDEDETAGGAPEQGVAPAPVESAAAVEAPPEIVEAAPEVEPVTGERDMPAEPSMPADEVAAASTGSPPGAPVAPEVPAPPRGPLETPAHEPDRDAAAAQRPSALAAAGLAELRRPEAVTAPYVPRGVMGYRMPLVSRQELPIQVVSGVVMPAHHTYVILRPGHWELLMEGGEIVLPAEPVEAVIEEPPARRRWSLFDLFRKRTPAREE